MNKDLLFADWAAGVAIAAFAVSLAVFVFFVVGAIRMPRRNVRRNAELPFKQDTFL